MNVLPGARAPVNLNSNFLDASMIYGSRLEVNQKLRGPAGSLKVNNSPLLKPGYILPPPDKDSMSCHGAGEDKPCMAGGDSRINQHTGVVALASVRSSLITVQ